MSGPHDEQPRSLAGQLLVASPYVANPHFARTVVLILQDNADGAAGVILNRPLGPAGRAVWQHLGQRAGSGEHPVFFGGPLAGPVVALHQDEALSEHRLGRKLFVAANVAKLGQLADGSHGPLRVFIGHAGWSSEQLARELRQGAWIVLPAPEGLVFIDQCELLSRSVRHVGQRVLEACLPPQALRTQAGWN